MKNTRKAFLAGLLLAGSALVSPAVVSAGVVVDVDIAPPAPQSIPTTCLSHQRRTAKLGMLATT